MAWEKGCCKGYYTGCDVWKFKDRFRVNKAFESRARRFQDGRTEIFLNTYSPFPTSQEKSKKRLCEMFYRRFGIAPRICIVEPGNKSKGCKDLFMTSVSFYAVFPTPPDLTGIQEDAEKELVEVRYKRIADGKVEVFSYDEISKSYRYSINAACQKDGYLDTGKAIWRLI